MIENRSVTSAEAVDKAKILTDERMRKRDELLAIVKELVKFPLIFFGALGRRVNGSLGIQGHR